MLYLCFKNIPVNPLKGIERTNDFKDFECNHQGFGSSGNERESNNDELNYQILSNDISESDNIGKKGNDIDKIDFRSIRVTCENLSVI